MAEYIVSIDNEESNALANTLSVTGRVNGVNCSALLKLSRLSALNEPEKKRQKQKALVAALRTRQLAPGMLSGESVTL